MKEIRFNSENIFANRMNDYVFSPAPNYPFNTPFKRMKLLRMLLSTEGKPFYAADLLGKSVSNGGLMCALSINQLIKPTGNTREGTVVVISERYDCYLHEWKKEPKEIHFEVKEWTAVCSYEELRAAYDELRQFIIDNV